MNQVRAAAVAGQFYPAQSSQLQADVDAMLERAASNAPCPKVIVAPHAGYAYSGDVAASVYARLRNGGEHISRVVLLGPSHRVGFSGIASCSADCYITPLGQIPLDKQSLQQLATLPGVVQLDEAHAQEHSLEVHLPFLQRTLGDFSLLPLVVGQAPAAEVAGVLNSLWGGSETLVVISSDMSHYLPYAQAQRKDAATTAQIEALQADLNGDQACGCKPLNGLLQVLRERQLGIETVQVKNSGDSAGSKERVVGYGSWVVNETPGAAASTAPSLQTTPLALAQRQQLLYLARAVISKALNGGGDFSIALNQYHPSLREHRGTFVTLNLDGRLRGCIGSLVATRPLLLDVAHNASAAAFQDHRFKPVSRAEFALLDVHISILSPALALPVTSRQQLIDRLRPGLDGVILQCGKQRSTYLPSVWSSLADAELFVSELRAKAGLPKAGWEKDMQVWTYTTDEFC